MYNIRSSNRKALVTPSDKAKSLTIDFAVIRAEITIRLVFILAIVIDKKVVKTKASFLFW